MSARGDRLAIQVATPWRRGRGSRAFPRVLQPPRRGFLSPGEHLSCRLVRSTIGAVDMSLEEEAVISEPESSNAHHNALEAYAMRGSQECFDQAARLVSCVEPRFVR